jgi:WD40 repeat protein
MAVSVRGRGDFTVRRSGGSDGEGYKEGLRNMTGIRICCALTAALLVSLAMVARPAAAQLTWDSETIRAVPYGSYGKSPVITGIALQPEGNLVAMAGDDHIVNLYDRERGEFVRQLVEHTDWIRAVRFSPDGGRLATAGNDRRLMLWNVDGIGRATEVARHPAAISDIAFSHNGESIATAGFENVVRIYTVASGELAREMTVPCKDMRAVAFSPDDTTLAVGGRDGQIVLFEASTGRMIATHAVHPRRVRDLQFLDAHRIASCGDDGRCRILNLGDGGSIRDLPALDGKLFALCCLKDGTLATAGSDNRIWLWNTETTENVGRLEGHFGTIACLDACDATLASAGFDTRAMLWTTARMADAGLSPPRR